MTHRLTSADAAIVKGMLARGDLQQDIAAYFCVNSGRIAETNTGQRFRDVAAAPAHKLPLAGPPGARHADTVTIAIAAEFRREQRRARIEQRAMNQKLDQMQRLLLALGRSVGLIENPQAPRITRRRPLEA